MEEHTRMSFSLPEDTYERFVEAIPWGVRSHFLRQIVETAVEVVEEGGYEVIGAIMSGDFKLFRWKRGGKK